MFTSTTCYNATLRNVENLVNTNAVARIGNVLSRFKADSAIQVLGTCGVVTHVTVIFDVMNKIKLVEVRVDDGIDQLNVALPYSKFEEINLGDVLQVMVKNKILSHEHGAILYASHRADTLGAVSVHDFRVSN